MYCIPNGKTDQSIIKSISRTFQAAYLDGKLKECFVGLDNDYRINFKDSYYRTITDPKIMFRYVLYPMYIESVGEERKILLETIEDLITELIISSEPLEYFQAFHYLDAERIIELIYGDLPFKIFTKTLYKKMISRLPIMENILTEYKEGEFCLYSASLYDTVKQIVESNNMFLDNDDIIN